MSTQSTVFTKAITSSPTISLPSKLVFYTKIRKPVKTILTTKRLETIKSSKTILQNAPKNTRLKSMIKSAIRQSKKAQSQSPISVRLRKLKNSLRIIGSLYKDTGSTTELAKAL